MSFNIKALYAALDAQRTARGLSWRQVAEETGVSSNSLFTRLSGGHYPDVDNLLRLTAWLGLPVEQFSRMKGKSGKAKGPPTMAQIASILMDDPDLKPERCKAILAIFTSTYNQFKGLK